MTSEGISDLLRRVERDEALTSAEHILSTHLDNMISIGRLDAVDDVSIELSHELLTLM